MESDSVGGAATVPSVALHDLYTHGDLDDATEAFHGEPVTIIGYVRTKVGGGSPGYGITVRVVADSESEARKILDDLGYAADPS